MQTAIGISFINVFIFPSVKNLKYVAGLVFVSMIWGGTFPLVKLSLQYISPMGFLTLRFLLATAILLAIYFKKIMSHRDALRASLILGIFLFLGYMFQTIGLKYTSSSNAGFITGLYVVFTPIFSYLIIKERITKRIIGALLISLAGLYLLSGVRGFNFGDILELFCAIAYGIHVTLIGKFSREKDAATLTMMQLFFVFLFSSIWWGAEGPYISLSPLLAFGIVFTGLFASALGILMQVHAQKHISPSKTAVIFTTEPAFAGIFSFVFLGEALTPMGIMGAVLILFAMLLAAVEKEHPGLE